MISKEEFELYLPIAMSPDEDTLPIIKGGINTAEEIIEEVLVPAEIKMNDESLIARLAKKWTALQAFIIMQPQLDLVLTPTGFGVVNTQNIAPASSERVNNLVKNIKEQRDECFDKIIELLQLNEKWTNSKIAKRIIDNFIYTGKICNEFGITLYGKKIYRTDIEIIKPKIRKAEEKLKEIYSVKFIEDLLAKERKQDTTSQEDFVIKKIREFIAWNIMNEDKNKGKRIFINELENYIEDNIEDFQIYKQSKQYEAKHLENYQNKKEDSTYFFG